MPTLPRPFLIALAVVLVPGAASSSHAWNQETQVQLAEEAARLAPPDLYRQLVRNREAYRLGVVEPIRRDPGDLHVENPDGSGRLAGRLEETIEQAILSIQEPRPFNEISYRLGVVAHYLTDLNDPLKTSESDPSESRYSRDFDDYVSSAEPRIRAVFYGFREGFESQRDVRILIGASLERSRSFYPLVGREYRRVGFASGRRAFDDRSTAYAVASLTYSHALSDIAEVLRYIWRSAGGIDSRPRVPTRGRTILLLPRDDSTATGR